MIPASSPLVTWPLGLLSCPGPLSLPLQFLSHEPVTNKGSPQGAFKNLSLLNIGVLKCVTIDLKERLVPAEKSGLEIRLAFGATQAAA